MSSQTEIKREVREFYNSVGWKEVSQGVYQNAHYEDLRAVSRDYIHACHLRVLRHLRPEGRYLLDAGSGPVQYPEYLEYSRGYQRRVCADISFTALKEAQKRLGGHGLYVVSDVANLPFKAGAFEGVVSLHTIHHLPQEEHLQAYGELFRVLAPGCSAAVVNGWPTSRLMRWYDPLIKLSNRLRGLARRLTGQQAMERKKRKAASSATANEDQEPAVENPKGTFTGRHGVEWVRSQVGARMNVEIYVWRSVSVRFLRAVVHPWLGGRLWLRLLFWLEECWPRWFGENGQYPLIVIRKKMEL